MNGLPRISIVIPVCNVEPYIAECLQSVMRQTYQGEIECIIVDDCGTDKSIEEANRVIAEYTGPFEFKVVHHEHNRGVAASRNTGTDAANGDYYYYLDPDDYITDDCLEVMTSPLKEKDYDMVLADCDLTDNPYHIRYMCRETGPVCGNENIFKAFHAERTLFMMVWNKLFKASLCKDHDLRFLEGQIHEDDLWTYKTTLYLESLYVQNVKTYIYRIRPGGITADYHSRTKHRLKSWMATVDYVLSHPAKVNKEYYDMSVAYDFEKVVRFIIHDDESHKAEYVALRRRFDYHPFGLFLKGKLRLSQLKDQLHLALPPRFGYAYIGLRKIGRRLFRKTKKSL